MRRKNGNDSLCIQLRDDLFEGGSHRIFQATAGYSFSGHILLYFLVSLLEINYAKDSSKNYRCCPE